MTKEEFEIICKKYDAIGASFFYVDKNQEKHYTFGYLDKEEGITTNNDTIYRIASISKTVLAIGAMILKERGLLDLDEDISVYLGYLVRNPYFKNDKITTRMLMTQTSSIVDGFLDEDMSNVDRVDGYNGVNGKKLNVPLKTLLVKNDSPYYTDLTFDNNKPGTNFIYSNFGCGILACIIERISNMNFDKFMEVEIFNKLGLDASYYAYKIKNKDRIASIYSNGEKITGSSFLKRAYDIPSIGNGYLGAAGGLFISLKDLSKIMMSFWNPKYQILKDETIKEMLEVNWVGSSFEYKKKGLQMIILEDIVDITLFGHFGSAYGLKSMMLFNPYKKTGICFACNGGNINSYVNSIPAISNEILHKVW